MKNIFLPDYLTVPKILIEDQDIQQLDYLVYGVVYWYHKMNNEKCTLSNESIAYLLHSAPKSISNSLSRLNAKKYVRVILDNRARKEIIPLIYYKTTSTDGEVCHLQMPRVPSTDGHNNKIYKNIYNDYSEGEPSHKSEKMAKNNYGPNEPAKSHSSLEPLTPERIWEIAKKKNINMNDAMRVHSRVIESIEVGNKYKLKDVNMALQRWINLSIDRGQIQEMGEMEKIVFELMSPTKLKELNDLAKEKGVI